MGLREASYGGMPEREPRNRRGGLRRVHAATAMTLLSLGGACGAVGISVLRGRDLATDAQPLEISMQRVVEIRASGASAKAQLDAHYLNIFDKVQEGIAQLSSAAKGSDATAEWARRALASVRESAQDPRR